jgi:hypothetical protein
MAGVSTRVKELIESGDKLFSARSNLLTLWQEIADQFYPERADFTIQRSLGDEFASHLMTGYPALARRELGNIFSAMLRPRGQEWFTLRTEDEATNEDATAKAYLERLAGIQRRAMYASGTMFVRCTKEADHDFAAFGQCVMSCELELDVNQLLYRTWHIRDVAWAENHRLQVDTVHLKSKHTARYLCAKFPKTVDPKLKEIAEKDPFREVPCRRIIVPADAYDLNKEGGKKVNKSRTPFVSIYVDCDRETLLEEVALRRSPFVIPRWQTVSGSQYAHSPATVIALADARLLQRITLTLLEAGEKAVDPPMLAVQDMIRSDINVFPGAVTWVDADYDERLGEVLRPLNNGASGNLAFGADMADRYQQLITEAFFLNKINLPPYDGKAMTATEVRQRIEEYVRTALPLFEPMEDEYNRGLCDLTADTLMDAGAFGNFEDMPRQLAAREMRFQFQSPLTTAVERQKAASFQESAQLLAMAAQLDPQIATEVDMTKAFREAYIGVAPADWLRPAEEAAQMRADAADQQEQMAQMMQAGQAGAVVEQAGKAGQALNGAMAVPEGM